MRVGVGTKVRPVGVIYTALCQTIVYFFTPGWEGGAREGISALTRASQQSVLSRFDCNFWTSRNDKTGPLFQLLFHFFLSFFYFSYLKKILCCSFYLFSSSTFVHFIFWSLLLLILSHPSLLILGHSVRFLVAVFTLSCSYILHDWCFMMSKFTVFWSHI